MRITTTLDQIRAIPGLYISDYPSACDETLLVRHRISHILCVLRWEDLQSHGTPQNSSAAQGVTRPVIQRKLVEVNDDETEDILGRLKGMTDWIAGTLARPHPYDNANPESTEDRSSSHTGGRVLVHCNQGISRSGAVVVAYIMKSLTLPFNQALRIARESRSLIAPNKGFEYQLRIWETCSYDVLDRGMDGDSVALERKAAYDEFLKQIDEIYKHTNEQMISLAKRNWLVQIEARMILARGADFAIMPLLNIHSTEL
ncbi:hypothetical protein ASPSYDRAFT_90383 [Aspergillus sydowii CBS 593.65]|uniref:protein-tyrosine-phosphatase n=1 Tax=Aspergillus sydowii CBS 593.65 TaxID=1036612 RepID=A0A1L9TFJ3_9EURO|nr:uncharacterized protein ASPSYDRAFT_90383 [Aspergillus sydowii CBS 593.65]OJJ58196.1 hypothetical protein ASPSYDRAFT_90383 [Aspergillus sydowii CBS 593.65]